MGKVICSIVWRGEIGTLMSGPSKKIKITIQCFDTPDIE